MPTCAYLPVTMSRLRLYVILTIWCVLCMHANARCQKLAGNGRNYAAAQCIAWGPGCTVTMAMRSRWCKPHKYPNTQSAYCNTVACAYCKCNRTSKVCWSWRVRTLCKGKVSQNARKEQLPSKSSGQGSTGKSTQNVIGGAVQTNVQYPRGPCVRKGNHGRVSIPVAAGVRLPAPWVRNGGCIVWRPQRRTRTIDRKGSGSLCYKFQVARKSTYYFTAITRAPHGTEHNDMWVRLMNVGLRPYRPETNKYRGAHKAYWFKAYQNNGRNAYSNMLLTIDHYAHQFETAVLTPGVRYKVCIAGRSSKFTVCALKFVACKRKRCAYWRHDIRAAVNDRTHSQCM